MADFSKIIKAGKGAVSRLIDEMRQTNPFEAKRLERMADEVPNLENLYKEEALKGLLRGDNAKGVMTMRPQDFEKFSTKLDFDPNAPQRFLFEPEGVPPNLTQGQYIKHLSGLQGFSDVPMLEVNTTPPRLKPAPFISGHEGRHRSRALVESGQPTGIVQFLPRSELREGLPRRSREEYLKALNEELERTNRMVRPQRLNPNERARPLMQLPEVYKKGGLAHMDNGGAAFGVFPQMKARRSRQDPEAAKQVPVDLARGVVAGALGAPGDIESLIRLLPGLDEQTILPTSEDILKRIPGGSDTPASRAASGLGILGGGFYTGPGSGLRAVSAVPKAVMRAGKEFVEAAGQPAVNVIKPKGGNWLTGSVEKGLVGYKKEGLTPEEVQALRARPPSLIATSMMQPERVLSNNDVALNNWIDRNLANYIKKEMATPEDPVRRLAEQGIDPQGRFQYNPERDLTYLQTARQELGYPPKGMGQSPQAKNWERIADEATRSETAGDIITKAGGDDKERFKDFDTKKYQNILKENPWLLKVDPSTPVYSPKSGPWSFGDTGFDHIIDVLREDLATGRIRPEQLSKVSMEQAVRRTYEYDQELAKKMAEAKAAARAGLPVYKEYPEKYRWIELNRPGAFASESEAMGHSVRGYEPPKGHPDWTPASGDSGSESYGHGGWEAIKSGRAKVYSLVDEKGQPHVTVEVRKKPKGSQDEIDWYLSQPEDIQNEITTKALQIHEAGEAGRSAADSRREWSNSLGEAIRQYTGEPAPQITQIKGKQNAAPKEEYLPFVQDFVKSGQWSDVGDLRNTGLENIENYKEPVRAAAEKIYPGQRFLTLEQIQPLVNAASENKMKSGGPVHMQANNEGINMGRMTLTDLIASGQPISVQDFIRLHGEQQMAVGGPVANTSDTRPDVSDGGQMISAPFYAEGGSTRKQWVPNFDDGGAAFGVFPHMKRKRTKQDPEAAKDLPVDLARGVVSGVLGAPGDVESMVRMLPGLDETTILPTSEDIEAKLPFKSDTPAGRAVTGAGQIAGGFYSGPGSVFRTVAGATKGLPVGAGLKSSGKTVAETLEEELKAQEAAKKIRLGDFPTTKPRAIMEKTKGGGYSVSPLTGAIPTEGLMMGRYSNVDPRNTVIPAGKSLTKKDLEQFFEKNKGIYQTNPEAHIGTWLDKDTGITYVDVAQRFQPNEIRKATKFGERTGQLAGYNVAKDDVFPVGNWQNFIQSPEFHSRLGEMGVEGRNYLAQHPTKEWWDMPGTIFETVYGQKNLPHVAGYTATTAPNTAPRENLQTMSEYMRRHIKGEPTVQPDYRVPEGMMTRQAGTKLGMEAGRAANLEKSSRGALSQLQRDKVREEAAAMMGDPNAVVLDRHWARIAEDPTKGVFTAVQEGVVPPGEPYQQLKAQVVQHSKDIGRDPRDASADIWTGIRETIRNKNELYGQKYRGSALTNESKSYADHFRDLISEKAKHLGISVEEMISRLNTGDANLLAYVMAAPLGYELMQEVLGQRKAEAVE